MKGQIIVGMQRHTEAIIPIGMVTLTGLKCDCICYECKGALEAVLNTTRRKHFRHNIRGNCNPMPETELHLLAKKIILDHTRLKEISSGKAIVFYQKGIANLAIPFCFLLVIIRI